MKNGYGGKRPGAGRPAGTKNTGTLAKLEDREFTRAWISKRKTAILEALLASACGLNYLVLRDPATGQFTRVTGDAEQVDRALSSGHAVEIYTQNPNIHAAVDLLNRCIDKPSEHVSISGADDGPIQVQWISPEFNSIVVDVTPEKDEVDDKTRPVKKVNGHVKPGGEEK